VSELGDDQFKELKGLLAAVLEAQRATRAELIGFKAEATERFDKLETRMDRMETRMDNMETRLDRMETRMDGMGQQLTRTEDELIRLGNKVDHLVDKRVEADREIFKLKRMRSSQP